MIFSASFCLPFTSLYLTNPVLVLSAEASYRSCRILICPFRLLTGLAIKDFWNMVNRAISLSCWFNLQSSSRVHDLCIYSYRVRSSVEQCWWSTIFSLRTSNMLNLNVVASVRFRYSVELLKPFSWEWRYYLPPEREGNDLYFITFWCTEENGSGTWGTSMDWNRKKMHVSSWLWWRYWTLLRASGPKIARTWNSITIH